MRFSLSSCLFLSFLSAEVICSVTQLNEKCENYKKNFQKSPSSTEGADAALGEFPHITALGYYSDDSYSFRCVGALISNRYIVAPAHCVVTSDIPKIVRMGVVSTNFKTKALDPELDYNVKNFTMHPKYNRRAKLNNIALIELENDVNFSDNVRPACLHTKDDPLKEVVLTEWGKNDNDKLLNLYKFNLAPTSNQECANKYSKYNINITESQMCAAYNRNDTCLGDLGGTLQVSSGKLFSLVAIPSFGRPCGYGYGYDDFPTVYTKIYSYLDWIHRIVWK